jgi:glycosyltransferase involved in cell wall biosynthesis
LSLIEAMHLGMPVVAVAATEVPHAVPQSAGFVSTDAGVLADGVRALMADAALARRMGKNARRWALRRYSLTRFLRDWDLLLEGVCHESRHGLGTREPARVAGGR